MSTATLPAKVEQDGSDRLLEEVVVKGNLAGLSAADRVLYYREVCRSLNLNPLTRPFEYITLNGKLTLYATRTATDQLRSNHGISIDRLEREVVEGIYIVTAHGHGIAGRADEAIGAVPIENLKGEARANAMMKAETKAKRRLTLSLAGLGWLDEIEVGSVPDVQRADVDPETGEIKAPPPSLRERIAEQRAQIEGGSGLTREQFLARVRAEDIPPGLIQRGLDMLFPGGIVLGDEGRARLWDWIIEARTAGTGVPADGADQGADVAVAPAPAPDPEAEGGAVGDGVVTPEASGANVGMGL